jgi:UDP-3-O-[3-hydroxymyristoyl] glucosamine N-acyltransferase
MPYTLAQLSDLLAQHGLEATVRGNPDRRVARVATLEEAGPDEISFLSNPKYTKLLQTTQAGAVVVKPDVTTPDQLDCLCSAEPYAAITACIVALHGYRQHPPPPTGRDAPQIHPSAEVGPNATIHPGATIAADVVIGADAVIYPGCYIGPRCRIGNRALLYPNVVIYDDCLLGDRVTLHAGTVIGNDGLGYAPVNGRWVKIPQIGIVEIEDDVEIGANCSIDRATLGRTKIGRGTKMSNLIAVGHGTHIGEHCMIVAQVGLAGSVDVGDHVTMAGQVGVVGHVRIGDNATIGAKAGVVNNVPDGATYLGQPAIPIANMKRQAACLHKLPQLVRTVNRLDREMKEIADPETPEHT